MSDTIVIANVAPTYVPELSKFWDISIDILSGITRS